MRRGTGFRLLLGAGLAAAAAVLGAAAFLRARPAAPDVRRAELVTAPVAPAPPPVAPPPVAAPVPGPAPPAAAHLPGPDQAPSTTGPPLRPEAAAPLAEAVLMARLRSAAGTDFALAVDLARAGNRRFPDSADAPERASIMIHALAAQGLSREARAEAEYAVNHYPDSPWVRDIAVFTGAHPHRNLTLTDGGVLQVQ